MFNVSSAESDQNLMHSELIISTEHLNENACGISHQGQSEMDSIVKVDTTMMVSCC